MKCLIVLVFSAVLLLAFSPAFLAQTSVDIDFGVRGGVFNGSIPLEVPNNHYFPDLYSTDQPQFPVTLGPTVGVSFNNNWYIRFEAARSRFRIHFARGTNGTFPFSGIPAVTAVTDGHTWQYPLLLTYMAGRGEIRPFAGGGFSLGSTFRGTTRTTTTSVVGPPPIPGTNTVTVTTTSSAPFDTRYDLTPYAFYVTGGVDARLSVLSIRPELRYAHWTGFNTTYGSFQDGSILFSPNQFEFLLGITVHPFPHRNHASR
jgi:hypothetical protein